MEELRLLTVRQPWASCIIRRCKTVENRTRPTPYRGLVAILSGTKIFKDERAREAARRCFGDRADEYTAKSNDFARGGIIGVAELYDVVTEYPAGGWWFTGPFGYLLRNARAIPFIPCNGYQNALVRCPPTIKMKILGHTH